MRKIIASLLCVALLVVLCSCAGPQSQGADSVFGSDTDLLRTDVSAEESSDADTQAGVTDTVSSGSQGGSVNSEKTDVSDGTDSEDTDDLEDSEDFEDPDDSSEDSSYGDDDAETPNPDGDSGSGDSLPPQISDPLNPVSQVLFASQHYVGLCDQLNSRIIICDLAVENWADDNAVVWEYDHDNSGKENLGWIAGLKFRDCPYYGGRIMIYCYPDHARLVSMDTKKTLLETDYSGTNPHSAEVLPDGTVLVASTSDNWVGIYPPGQEDASSTITFPSAHGVLWDPANQIVWVAGSQDLGAFRVVGSGSSLRLEAVAGKQYKTPKNSVHDLAPLYGDNNKLLITCASGAVLLDKVTGTFSYNYSGGEVGRTFSYIPGCGNFTDGVFAFTAISSATKVYQDWDTNVIQVYVPTGDGKGVHVTRVAPEDAYYKLRVYNFNYQ